MIDPDDIRNSLKGTGELPIFDIKEPILDVLQEEGTDTDGINESAWKNLLKKDPKNSSINLTKKDESGAPIWNAVKLGDMLSKSQLQSVSQSLNSVLSVLKASEDALNAAESLIGIIQQLESLVKDVIGTLLDSIIKLLETFLNNLGSTGIYGLNSISPYILNKEQDQEKDSEKQSIIDYINSLNVSQKESYFEDTLANLESEFGEFDEEKRKEYKEILNTGRWIFNDKIIKVTSYSDFIQKIADAYINNEDKPSNWQMGNEIKEWGEGLNSLKAEGKEAINDIKNYFSLERILYSTKEDAITYPGAPQWGPGSISYNIVFATNLIDVNRLIINAYEIWDAFKNLNKLFSDDPGDGREYEDTEINKTKKPYSKLSPPPSGDMRWEGKNVENIFPGFFKSCRQLLNFAKSESEKDGDSWTDVFQDGIEWIKRRIRRIRRFIKLISSLIKLLTTLQNISLNMLVIQSRDGVYDIYDQLLSATGFPGQEEDEKSVILGVVLAAGAPSPDLKDLLLNFPDVLKDLQKTIDTETGEIVDRYDTPRDGGEAGLKRLMSFFKKQK